ncbi:hypothetical protein [Desulfosporosinus sp. OT]|uniref:hypothetical protein n=1 Tax=Desulfosporosinus sp. OT TaxID=913865 RepID=UPI0002239C97|nr:hypothetical protein [Desulfosporosinus sp. OT]EGW40145.1 hypothetical protein DOT_1946 [Desulfosporosinus sp. OT]
MHSIVDSILFPMETILQGALSYLGQISLVAGRGLNLNYFLGPIVMMGSGWQMLVGSIVSSAFLLLMVLIVRKTFDMYLAFKSGVKWW